MGAPIGPFLIVSADLSGFLRVRLADDATEVMAKTKDAALNAALLLQQAQKLFNESGQVPPKPFSEDFAAAGIAPDRATALPWNQGSQKALLLGFGDSHLILPMSKDLARELGKALLA
jgi:hypothetical protein